MDLDIIDLLPSTVSGTTISEGVIASAHGLLDSSSTAIAFPFLLSLLLSRILFGSPRTARARFKPDELELERDSCKVLDDVILDVSITRGGCGDLPRDEISSSTHPAGVGGTGPKVDCNGGGRRVGGETTRSEDLVILCDRDCGGGPGGGGGNGMPGSHLDTEEPRDRDDVGVSAAEADAALLDAGGLASMYLDSSSSCRGTAVIISGGLRELLP